MLASVSLLFDVEVGLLPKEEKLAVNIPLSCTRMRHKCVVKQKGTASDAVTFLEAYMLWPSQCKVAYA